MSDKLKSVLGWVIIISLLLTVASIWRYVGAYARSIQPTSFRSFAASGEGKVVVVPDVAEFTFSVVTEGGLDIGKLQTDNTEKVNQAISFLKGLGLEAKDIKTDNYNLSPRYQNVVCSSRPGDFVRICPPASIAGYSINQGVAVKIHQNKFDKIGEALSGVVKQGANTVSQLNFTVDNRTAAENEARASAIAEAKSKAKSVAKAAGFSLGELLGIDEGGSPEPFMKYGLESARGVDAMPSAPAPAIEPGSQEIRINVTLRYEID